MYFKTINLEICFVFLHLVQHIICLLIRTERRSKIGDVEMGQIIDLTDGLPNYDYKTVIENLHLDQAGDMTMSKIQDKLRYCVRNREMYCFAL